MEFSTLFRPGAAVLLLATLATLPGRAGEQVFSFADPAAPGKVVIQIGVGEVRVVGADVPDVRVVSERELDAGDEPRSDGLRRLDRGSSHAVARDGNVLTIAWNSLYGGRSGDGGDLLVTVPRSAGVVVERAGPGQTVLETLAGDCEIRAAIGDVVLEDVSGGAVVETINGDVRAVFSQLPSDRPVSISAVRGDVHVFVPEATRCDVRFRTLHGEVLTDFGDELKTDMQEGWSGTGGEDIEEGMAKADEARRLAREAQRKAREDARRAQEDARRVQEEVRQAQVQVHRGAGKEIVTVMVPPIPPLPPMPAIPAMAGGRLVAGTLNGGGSQVSVTTLNGDIRFRKSP